MILIYSINYLAPQKNSKKKVAQPQFYRESSNPVENQSETFPRRGIKITGRGESAQSPLHFPFPVPLLRLAGPGEGKSWKMKGRSLKGERERERSVMDENDFNWKPEEGNDGGSLALPGQSSRWRLRLGCGERLGGSMEGDPRLRTFSHVYALRTRVIVASNVRLGAFSRKS